MKNIKVLNKFALFIIAPMILFSCSVKDEIKPIEIVPTEKVYPLEDYILFSDDYLEYKFYYPLGWTTGKMSLSDIGKTPFYFFEKDNPGNTQDREGYLYGFYKYGDKDFRSLSLIVDPLDTKNIFNSDIWIKDIRKGIEQNNGLILDEDVFNKINVEMAYLKYSGIDPNNNIETYNIIWSFPSEKLDYLFLLQSRMDAKLEMDDYFELLLNTIRKK